jgi:LysM domain
MEAEMSTMTSIEAPVTTDAAEFAADLPESSTAARPLRLVTDSAPDRARKRVPAMPGQSQPRSSSIAGRVDPRASSIARPAREPLTASVLTPSAVIAPRPRVAADSPVRLTQRGRALVVGLLVAVAAAAALLISLAAAGGAQAANHGQPGGGGYQGMHEVVVRPGQTLWSIASTAEPGADPRLVVQQIMSANAMTSTDISAGQLLWVPR